MNETLKLGLILLIITAVSATVLGVSNDVTKGKIAEADKLANDNARKEVLSNGEDFKPLDENELNSIISSNPEIIEIYEGLDSSGNTIGYTIKTLISGFGGDMEVMTGISVEGKIMGMKVLNHSETPGLGANAEEPEFENRFENKPVDDELIVVTSDPSNENEVLAITSATITSDAVTGGVNIAREVYNKNLAQ